MKAFAAEATPGLPWNRSRSGLIICRDLRSLRLRGAAHEGKRSVNLVDRRLSAARNQLIVAIWLRRITKRFTCVNFPLRISFWVGISLCTARPEMCSLTGSLEQAFMYQRRALPDGLREPFQASAPPMSWALHESTAVAILFSAAS